MSSVSSDLLRALSGTALGYRLAQCGERRGFVDNPYKFLCNQPACPRCRRRYVRWRVRHLSAEFLGAGNLAALTVRPALVGDPWEAVRSFTDIRQALRNAARRRTWRGLSACGHLSAHFIDGRFWPELSAVADLNRIAYQDFRRDLATVFSVVRVQPVGGNAKEVFSDQLHRQLSLSGCPPVEAAAFYSALYAVGGGFRPLMFTRGLKAPPGLINDEEPEEVEPLPVAFGWC